MIKSKDDYLEFLKDDQISLGIDNTVKNYLFDDIWKFQRLLRKIEYFINCKKGFFNTVILYFLKYRYKKLSVILGFSISPNTFDRGLSIAHYGDIVINGNAKIGKNCRLHSGVCVGESKGKVPNISDNVYLGPGCKVIGDVFIAKNVLVAANSVVVKNIIEENITIGGIPAKKISGYNLK